MGLGLQLNNNNLLDISLGFENLTLGLANTVTAADGTSQTLAFAIATATNANDGGDDIYLGVNGTANINLNLTLLTGEPYADHVALFVRNLISNFALTGDAVLTIGKLVLFQQNYTFTGLALSLSLDSLGINLGDTLSSAVESLLNGLSSSSTSNTTNSSAVNPIAFPIALLTNIMLGTPYLRTATGVSIPNMVTRDAEGNIVQTPKDAQDIGLVAQTIAAGTQLTISISGLSIPANTIPIHVGLGATYLELDTNSTNQYGNWAPLIGIAIPDYIALGPDTTSISLTVQVTIFQSDTLCAFLAAITNARNGPTCDLRITGSMSLNLTGVYIPDLTLSLPLQDLYLSLDINSLIAGLVGSSSALQPGRYCGRSLGYSIIAF